MTNNKKTDVWTELMGRIIITAITLIIVAAATKTILWIFGL